MSMFKLNDKSTLSKLCLYHFIGGFRSEKFQKLLDESKDDLFDFKITNWLETKFIPEGEFNEYLILSKFFDRDRPLIDRLEEIPLNIMSAGSILKSDIFKEYRKRPDGKIVKVSFC